MIDWTNFSHSASKSWIFPAVLTWVRNLWSRFKWPWDKAFAAVVWDSFNWSFSNCAVMLSAKSTPISCNPRRCSRSLISSCVKNEVSASARGGWTGATTGWGTANGSFSVDPCIASTPRVVVRDGAVLIHGTFSGKTYHCPSVSSPFFSFAYSRFASGFSLWWSPCCLPVLAAHATILQPLDVLHFAFLTKPCHCEKLSGYTWYPLPAPTVMALQLCYAKSKCPFPPLSNRLGRTPLDVVPGFALFPPQRAMPSGFDLLFRQLSHTQPLPKMQRQSRERGSTATCTNGRTPKAQLRRYRWGPALPEPNLYSICYIYMCVYCIYMYILYIIISI